MERSHPLRSGIPTYLGSTPGRIQTPEQDRGDGVAYQTPRRGDATACSSQQRKDKPSHTRHPSPRLQRSGHNISSGHLDGQEGKSGKLSHAHDSAKINACEPNSFSRHGRSAKDVGQMGHPYNKHRPPTGRYQVTYAHIRRSDTYKSSQNEAYERNVVGCETSSDQMDISTTDQAISPTSLYRNTDTNTKDACYGGYSVADMPVPRSGCDGDGEDSTNPSTNTSTQKAEADVDRKDPGHKSEASSADVRSWTPVMDPHTLAAISEKDYPIRGTISPLSNTVAVKRSVGPVDEVSFVFGRPASPTSEQTVRGNGSHQHYSNPGIVRCLSPSAGRYTSGSYSARPLSPSSDVLPMRRVGTLTDRRVLSPPPFLGVGAAAEPRIHHQGGICCEHCNGCLVELKRQALRLMFPDNGEGGHLAQSIRIDNIGERLTVPESYDRWYNRTGQCGVCETPIGQLKQEAVAMIQSIQLAQTTATPTSIPSLVGSCGIMSQQRTRNTSRKPPPSPSSPYMPLAAQAQAYLEHNVRAYINPKKYSMMMSGRVPGAATLPSQDGSHNGLASPESLSDVSSSSSQLSSYYHQHHYPQWPGHPTITSPVPFRSVLSPSPTSSPSSPPPVPSAAVSFFARAAQKLGKKKKRHHSQDQEPLPAFPTNFSDVIRLTPPPAPPCLLRTVGRLQNPGMGKVKVMLKICSSPGSQGEQGASFLSADPRKKQVTVFDPSASGYVTSASRRAVTAAPKMFAFDSVFTPDDSLTELCASSLAEIIQAVVAGADGCLFTYGYSKLGKTFTMIGSDQSPGTLGVMPCAIAWLFKLINEQKDKTGARFSVRVSAVQVTGKEEMLKDLLTGIAQGTEATGVGTAPSVYLREDPICGTQLENQSELRAPTAEKAAYYLDAALAARYSGEEDEGRSSHILFTLNVYQYRIERSNTKAGLPGVAGGRSRLHLIDLGTASKSKDPNNVSLSLSALGNVIMALLNGQRHVPHRDSKIAQLLRDSLGNLSCRTCMIAHVSSAVPHYNETLQVIQLAARIHRMKRRRTKFSSTSSEDSSTDGDVKFRRPYRGLRMGTLREDVLYSSSHSDPDYTSSSEQSCDTVIYIGANGQSLSDRELTDNEGPPRHVPRTNPRLPRRPSGSRSSGDDSDSGRSVHSVRSLESRLPLRTLMSPQLGLSMGSGKLDQPQSIPGSPNPGLVKMGHRGAMHTKMNSDSRNAESAQASGVWQDKTKIHCHSSQSKLAKAIHEKQQPLEGEQWIDGPGAAIYPEPNANEMWVDGPQAFVVQQQLQSTLSSSPSSRADVQHHGRGELTHHHHHRSESSSRRVASKKVDAEEQWVDGPKEMLAGSNPSQPMHTCSKSEQPAKAIHPAKNCMSTGVSERALKQALVKHIMEVKDRPDSTISVDSESSLAVAPAESRPVSFNSSDEQCSGSLPKTEISDGPSRTDLKQDASSSPMVSSKKQKLSDTKRPNSSKQSPTSSPSPSPALPRKYSKGETSVAFRLQKSQLPGSSSPTHRVVEWIKSVSTDKQSPEHVGQINLSSAVNIVMTDAETNTEHDSDFERMAEENGVRSDSDDGVESMPVKGEHIKDRKCNVAVDTSLESSLETSMMNRESIYEMEVDEHLERMKTKDGSRLAADVDNETFSSLSCSNHDDVDREQCMAESESLLFQHTKALTESKQTAQLNQHLAKGFIKRDVSPPESDNENDTLEVSRPLLSRKPDGASNPNLMKTFFEDDILGKEQYCSLPSTSQEALFVRSNHNDSGIEYQTTSSKSCREIMEDEDSFCETSSLHSLTGKSSSPKQGSKSKPPLPNKQSQVLKPNVVPKACLNSSSSPSRSIYCMAKPSLSSKDTYPAPQKAAQTGKMSSVPVVSPSMKIKFSRSEKASTSSSGTSPVSSATSSPLVSTTSKSSSSSPAQKAGSKSLSGSISKLPSFNTSRTSSPSTKDSKSRKKDKEKETKGGGSSRTKLSELVHKGKGNDSDSGNDSGIVTNEKKLLSPYATVTKPRTPSHSSSGHGSDNSTISTEVHPGHSRPCTKAENLHGGTSSGYESMLRDSEATCSSSGHEDSGSESSSECKKGSKRKGTQRSRSAPAHSTESSPASSQPSQTGSRSAGSAPRAWVDTRHLHKVKDEPLELKLYDPDEVERLGRRRTDEETFACSDGKQKSTGSKGDENSGDGSESKDRIMMERNGWSFDCKLFLCFSCKSRQRGTDV